MSEKSTWQETVMTKDQIEEVKYLEIRENPEYRDLRLLEMQSYYFFATIKSSVEDEAIARRQAEITWKAAFEAGQESTRNKDTVLNEPWDREQAIFEDGVQKGRREVVEWFIDQTDFPDDDQPYYVLSKKVWQAELKEWEIEN